MDLQRKRFIAKLEGHIGIWGNALLFVFKFWVGWMTNSVAIMADAWHSLSDSISSILVIVGIKVSERPPDRKHPFGYGRAEILVSVVIAVLLGVIGFEFAIQGVKQLIEPENVTYGTVGIVAMAVSILVKEGMAQYAYWAARKTGFSSLKADGHHHRSDAISSILILLGIIFGGGFWWMDGVLSILVALIILHAGWSVFQEAGGKLLGESPSTELSERISRICVDVHGGDLQFHHLHIHQYGDHSEITFHICFDGTMPLKEAHRWAELIEAAILDNLKMIATIHVEPVDHKNNGGANV